ncbi:MAG: hypothetical protein HDS70_03930 [Bacteroidales bacterium]|nr:hypothetical protein [Bacteroidales bacterium]MBD5221501.1 hypothetical protein [Bacteroidales bacterium]
MKIVSLNDRETDVKNADAFLLIADSALGRNGRPFFVPEEYAPYECMAAVAFRITRLGKSIPERFAHRYHDSGSPALMFRSIYASKQDTPSPAYYSFDSAVIAGEEAKEGDEVVWSLKNNDCEVKARISGLLPKLHRGIAAYSQMNMLRMGDMILIPVATLEAEVTPEMEFRADCGGKELLKVRTK